MVHVLLVSGHPMLWDVMERVLNQMDGMKIVGKVTCLKELSALIARCPVDVVFLQMPFVPLDHFEPIFEFVRRQDNLKIIIFSVRLNCKEVKEFFKMGINGYLTQSSKPAEWIAAVQAVAMNKRYISAEVSDALALNCQGDVSEENPFSLLAKREREIASFLLQGMEVGQIATRLSLDRTTVNSYRYRVFEKLNVKSDVGLCLFALEYGLID